MNQTYIIAEAGVNHNGNIDLAVRMIEEAKKAGVDAVKFQTFKSENIVLINAPKADYQKETTGNSESQYEMLKKLELSFEHFKMLKQKADEIGIEFLSTPFDFESIEFLDTLGMPLWKIPSGEITNMPYLMKIAQTKRPIILSTGMSDLEEITEALELFKTYDRNNITLLQCNTEYPTPYSDVNLRAMRIMAEAFGVKVGYSDHTKGIEIAIAAVAMGACVIEKHFTLDRNLPGPDHKASLEPVELAQMVKSIRNVELAIGDGIKKPSMSEMKNRAIARKSIVAKTEIHKTELFTEDNITTKRPGDGISPMRWSEILGQAAIRDYHKDDKIEQ
ncbi:MAG TPA: N-acetylneuraminate synthase [Mobilitalea sp.]|nr:N-acetylneuraminate synthase [Mobilitalea sp.]